MRESWAVAHEQLCEELKGLRKCAQPAELGGGVFPAQLSPITRLVAARKDHFPWVSA